MIKQRYDWWMYKVTTNSHCRGDSMLSSAAWHLQSLTSDYSDIINSEFQVIVTNCKNCNFTCNMSGMSANYKQGDRNAFFESWWHFWRINFFDKHTGDTTNFISIRTKCFTTETFPYCLLLVFLINQPESTLF